MKSVSLFVNKRNIDSPYHVVIDLRWMKPSIAGGIENLSRSFLNELLSIDAFNYYTILVPSEVQYDFDVRKRENYKIVAFDSISRYLKFGWRNKKAIIGKMIGKGAYQSLEVNSFSRISVKNIDAVLSLSGYIYPDMLQQKNILVVLDLQHEYFPEFFSSQDLIDRKNAFNRSINNAEYLIAISEYTRQTVIDKLKISADKIETAHLAADKIFKDKRSFNITLKNNILAKYNLSNFNYFFFPGNTWKHKNHSTIIRALRILNQHSNIKHHLVCSGADRDQIKSLSKLITSLNLNDYVHFLGYCPTEDLPGLYQGAVAMVFPSLFEGFGMPLVEAMESDCPIICSNATCLPEIAGDAALFANPYIAKEFAVAMNDVINNASLRKKLINNGKKKAQAYTWKKFTKSIVRILHEQCNGLK